MVDVTIPPATDVTQVDSGLLGTSGLGNIVYADLNKNSIRDSNETGVGGVAVEAVWSGIDGIIGNDDDVEYRTITAADGSWALDPIPAGEYVVTIDPATLPSNLSGVPAVTVLVVANAITNVDLPVIPAAAPRVPLALTGAETMRLVWLSVLLMGAGAMLLAIYGRREDELEELPVE